MGLKPRRGRPRVRRETALSRWIDANIASDEQQPPREQFAARLGVTRAYVDKLCRGDAKPSLEAVLLIDALTKGQVSLKDWGNE